MDDKKFFEINLSDLRRLGKQGGATAHLQNGEMIELKTHHATMKRKGYVAGKLQDVDVILSYATIYSQIRTIMRNKVVIARRVKTREGNVLRSTGKGYSRLSNKNKSGE